MYIVRVESHFSSAHNLRGYKGKCEDLHGHNWKVELAASNNELDELGMIVDFKELKDALNKVLSELDHKYLNDVDFFRENNPTSENLAKYIYSEVLRRNPGIGLSSVTVWETETASATYSEQKIKDQGK